jgi:hypothetical protein
MAIEASDKLLELEADELVLWSGKPAPYIVLDKYYKPVFIRNYIIALVIVVPIFLLALARNADSGGLNITALAVMCAIPLVVIPFGLSQYRDYGKKAKYFITNKNIIVIWDARKLKFPLDNIDKLDSVPQAEGTVSVRIGKAAGIPVRKNRGVALRSLTGNSNEDQANNNGCLLYNLSESDAGTVLELIDQYRVIA